MSVIVKGMEMPEKCGSCDLFHAESPMHCTVVKGHKTVGAPYGMPRPEWCPLIETDDSDGWIPCSERLPEEYEVLCCDIRGEIMIGHPFSTSESSTGFSAESEHEYMYDCVAWMPKPKGYRPKENKQ